MVNRCASYLAPNVKTTHCTGANTALYKASSPNKRGDRGSRGEKEGKRNCLQIIGGGRKKKKGKREKWDKEKRPEEEKKAGGKRDRWVSKALVALLGRKRMPLIMRCLFYPPALCLSRCYACFPPAPIISALEPGDNNEFTEIEKCRGLNCMYLVTQTEAMAWERLVSQWHHLATQPL